MKCELCGSEITRVEEGAAFQKAAGWLRVKDGKNFRTAKRWPAFAHETCLKRQMYGVHPRQESLV